jgi:hypothetical protein
MAHGHDNRCVAIMGDQLREVASDRRNAGSPRRGRWPRARD